MGFIVIEQWGDSENDYKFHCVQVCPEVFSTEEEAREEVKRRKPSRPDGIILVRPEGYLDALEKRNKKAKRKR